MKLTTYLAVFVFLLFTALSASSQESAPVPPVNLLMELDLSVHKAPV